MPLSGWQLPITSCRLQVPGFKLQGPPSQSTIHHLPVTSCRFVPREIRLQVFMLQGKPITPSSRGPFISRSRFPFHDSPLTTHHSPLPQMRSPNTHSLFPIEITSFCLAFSFLSPVPRSNSPGYRSVPSRSSCIVLPSQTPRSNGPNGLHSSVPGQIV